MPTLVDLTRTMDPENRARVHESFKALETVIAPRIQYLSPESGGLERMMSIFGCQASDLPDGEGWGRTC
ncbi:hypothetical protein [Thermocatellispora tengchongensis]|uniref:hypothetical protein n=1 Tax=Thermocatellispora tengchongensis TaxID=1073253 RepID=UPI0036266178